MFGLFGAFIAFYLLVRMTSQKLIFPADDLFVPAKLLFPKWVTLDAAPLNFCLVLALRILYYFLWCFNSLILMWLLTSVSADSSPCADFLSGSLIDFVFKMLQR